MAVNMTHPHLGSSIRVRDESVDRYSAAGWLAGDSVQSSESPAMPAKNASTETWHTYALDNGYDADDLTDLGRDDIVALFE